MTIFVDACPDGDYLSKTEFGQYSEDVVHFVIVGKTFGIYKMETYSCGGHRTDICNFGTLCSTVVRLFSPFVYEYV